MNNKIDLFTIGFTKKSAKTFFELLQKAGVKKIIDTRLNNVSQLSGFAKRKDLEYFLNTILGIEYSHILDLAPTKDILDEYKKGQGKDKEHKGDWSLYEKKFLRLMSERQIERKVSPELADGACLLCSESEPHYCHRRLVAEYLSQQWGNVLVHHL
jgi:uncharacterized protein (DUF488 family)